MLSGVNPAFQTSSHSVRSFGVLCMRNAVVSEQLRLETVPVGVGGTGEERVAAGASLMVPDPVGGFGHFRIYTGCTAGAAKFSTVIFCDDR